MKLRRPPIEAYRKFEPKVMSKMSQAAVFYAIDDMLADLLTLADSHKELLSACQSAISHLEWSLTAEDSRCIAMRAAIQKATT